MLESLRASGIEVVQLKWNSGLLTVPVGSQLGPHIIMCRPATVFQWVHDNVYAPLGVTSDGEHCGFCITGTSGGASAVAYATTRYGVVPDAVIPVSGPMHFEFDRGCLLEWGSYYYKSDSSRVELDAPYGFKKSGGPCLTHDSTWSPRWQADGIEAGDLFQPFRVEVIMGEKDVTGAIPHAADFVASVTSAGSQDVHYSVLPGVGHELVGTATGSEALKAAILY